MTQENKIIYNFEEMNAHEINTLDRMMRRNYAKLYITEDTYFHVCAKTGDINYRDEEGDSDFCGVDLAEALYGNKNQGRYGEYVDITSGYLIK